MNQLDPGRPRAGDTAEAQRAPVDMERAGVGPDETGRDAGEGRLAGAVLAHHGVNGAALEGDRELGECRDLAVCDANPRGSGGPAGPQQSCVPRGFLPYGLD